MTTTVPTIIAPYVAVLAILGAVLTVNVIINRARTKIDMGDGGVAKLAQAVRAHSNFTEQVPLALIAIALAESLGTMGWLIHLLCIGLVVSRLVGAYALNKTLNQSPGRQFGASLSILVTAAAGVAIIVATSG